uniref:Schwannomin-interacting protein 1-like isoform X2 n=1 Tax=Geotrypetes seraphini TaxID=260995 RepID=A0A6P8PVY3_GEOSA|nr:schwannomin-interacting protein 1-like isoform X2 [Geotrypetes seraphini]XP_033778964.1 schwannomin-interacting protein 1-like isoform X2 [Geotrypetes seraphini]XP_033778965.1 schwannomin-interacting protein 1-like isoform X2 [Geotrypetes seraphini]
MEALGLPALDWGALETHLAQTQEGERQKELQHRLMKVSSREKMCSGTEWDPATQPHVLSEELGEDTEISRRITFLTNRVDNYRNLQLCFINDSGSDIESDHEERGSASIDSKRPTNQDSPLKASLPSTEQLPSTPSYPTVTIQETSKLSQTTRKEKVECQKDTGDTKCRLEFTDLQRKSLLQLQFLRDGISQDIQRLNVELMNELIQRDELQVEHDAVLLDLEDWTKVAKKMETDNQERWTKVSDTSQHQDCE